MGSCCFTPRRTQFLWWYWLLLASIVGIPMFLACWYVARHKPANDEAKKNLGRKASLIFWSGTLASAAFIVFVGWHIYQSIHTEPRSYPMFTGWEWFSDFEAFVTLLAGFLTGVAVWTALGTAAYKGSIGRMVGMLLVFLLLTCVFPFGLLRADPSDLPMLWAACILPAHFFGAFTREPTQRTALNATIGFVVGAFLYWAVMKYWAVGNLCLYLVVRGKLPDARDIMDLLNFNQSRF